MGDILPLKDALIYVIFCIVTPSLSTGSSEKVDFWVGWGGVGQSLGDMFPKKSPFWRPP